MVQCAYFNSNICVTDVQQINLRDTGTFVIISSVFPNAETPDEVFDISHIIDENKNLESNADACSCCAATSGKEQNQWMELDLRKAYLIERIVVTGRSDGK